MSTVLIGAAIEAPLLLRAERYMFVFAPLAYVAAATITLRLADIAVSVTAGATRKRGVAIAGLAVVSAGLLGPVAISEWRIERAYYANPSPSGMRALVSQCERIDGAGRILYVVSPDYLSASLASSA